jgi:anti-sigma-K factor RskA
MMAHDEMLDNVAAYALGALPADEAKAVAAHLQTCPECREEYRALRPAVTAVGYTAEACTNPSVGATASPLLKERLMRQVRAEAASRRRAPAWPGYAVAAASLALAVGGGLAAVTFNARIERDRTAMVRQAQTIDDLAAADATRRPFGHGEVLMHRQRLYLMMHRLPMPPHGMVYQAWTQPKGAKRMAPSITFVPEPNGESIVRLPESAEQVAAVAVSMEPAGGSLQPTSKPIAIATL